MPWSSVWIAGLRPAFRLQNLSVRARDYVPTVLGGVVCFGIGIAIYFAAPFEPSWVWICAIGLVLAVAVWATRKDAAPWHGWALVALLIWVGAARANWHTAAADSPKLRQSERSYSFTGWVEAIERSGTGERIHLRITEVERLPEAAWPKSVRLRITAKNSDVKAGQTVRVRGAAKAPSDAALPGGYNPARAAYFQEIGGFGFTYGAPQVLDDVELGLRDKLSRAVVRWRYGLAERIYAEAPTETAGLQTALITGVRRYIPPNQVEDLRVSGLAHILAISGLHMGLLAGESSLR
ncbi:ComEC/Rec2 family competence protein [Litorimonas sp. RW-G-Af-16]|uniref:ComEC/Rec2 family competence protein n=1 Tax=Litorimonas sp. RW-G-Af-16 TaxID=3241168 RepID=UPI003AAE6AD8